MIADSADRLSAGGCSRCRGAGLRHLIKKVKHDKDGGGGDKDDDKDVVNAVGAGARDSAFLLKRSNMIKMGMMMMVMMVMLRIEMKRRRCRSY